MTIASFLIEVSLNLDDTQFPSVLAHEFMHLILKSFMNMVSGAVGR